jgi:hypothetical protein
MLLRKEEKKRKRRDQEKGREKEKEKRSRETMKTKRLSVNIHNSVCILLRTHEMSCFACFLSCAPQLAVLLDRLSISD